VPADSAYIIKRIVDATQAMFNVKNGGTLEIIASAGSQLILDGGAIWSDPAGPAGGASNSGVTSNQALVYVATGFYETKFILGPNVILRNNDRKTTPGDYHNGGAIEVRGSFVMNGGLITSNRTSGNGGAVFLHNNNKDARITGGAITGNDAGLSGGGIMLGYSTGISKLIMTGGLISENRANGKISGFVSSSLGGYGGGIFIPGVDTTSSTNSFQMTGGTIQNNISASGKGNGIVVDLNNTGGAAPVFSIGGTASLVGNDVLLHVDPSRPAPKITVNGPFNPSTAVLVTLDNYGLLPTEVLAGSFGPYLSRFTAAPYNIDSSGRIY
jgi:hypothetical protein